MKKNFVAVLAVILMISGVALFLQQRQQVEAETTRQPGNLRVVSTNSIIDDMVKQVGGDKVTAYSIVKRGTDPHEYEPQPTDITATADADVVFYNGLQLETGGNGWFKKLVKASKKDFDEDVFAASQGVTVRYLTTNRHEADPHAWLDLANGQQYVETISRVLQQKDPENAAFYQKNARAYQAKLAKLHQSSQAKFAKLPANQRLLVTSEGAFKYFAAAYQIQAAYIWEVNTESQGTPEQMQAVVKKIRQSNVKNLFVETSVSPKSMQKLSQETDLPIKATLYTDSLGAAGSTGATYYQMMHWNLTKIYQGLANS
ncbi:zinc ABC transporter substrate-binding protein [Lactiplantibacillus sp. WILCCON 0030]|uniref:Zinc ABC transporter substrate-binding protein n=1 Tax=Lactiplantibacillus brownii TaxID=3069269 RepID=A0ABU1A8W6_9LACO|nr:zinc ABC transporter substrate-binding protein [Lactiplantibacillus brownii]MDQ7936892.1 zinc ABC transporter substrate-binding protein [Lactiplantibacillus brownii]